MAPRTLSLGRLAPAFAEAPKKLDASSLLSPMSEKPRSRLSPLEKLLGSITGSPVSEDQVQSLWASFDAHLKAAHTPEIRYRIRRAAKKLSKGRN